jgi:type I restriction enzyme M protein
VEGGGLHHGARLYRATSWILFLKYLDDLEQGRAVEAELVGKPYAFIIDAEHKWSKWAAPKKANGTFDMTTR